MQLMKNYYIWSNFKRGKLTKHLKEAEKLILAGWRVAWVNTCCVFSWETDVLGSGANSGTKEIEIDDQQPQKKQKLYQFPKIKNKEEINFENIVQKRNHRTRNNLRWKSNSK